MSQRRLMPAVVRPCFTGIVTLAVIAIVSAAFAAPHDGDPFNLEQPDGSLVPVLVWGDEFYQTVETPDGFTLIRDKDGWICYAELSADGNEYVSTGIRYTGSKSKPRSGSMKKIRVRKEVMLEKHRKNREFLGYNNDEMIPEDNTRRPPPAGFAPAPMEPTKSVGLTLLASFPAGMKYDNNGATNQTEAATKAGVSRQGIDDFCNRVGGFNGNSANGSVRDWFLDVSHGLRDYSNIVVDYLEVNSPKSFYDRGTGYNNARTFVTELYAKLKTEAEAGRLPELHTLSLGSSNRIMATNILYSGSPAAGWSNGLWPHMSSSGPEVVINLPAAIVNDVSYPAKTIRTRAYQMTSLGTANSAPNIGTFVHENGHLLMSWPDYYNYDNTVTNVVTSYCVMSSNNGANPQVPNPMDRARAGWLQVINITNLNGVYTHRVGSDSVYQFVRNTNESYYIEAHRRAGRRANLGPSGSDGLLIWHVHRSGNNIRLNANNPFPLLKVVQANIATSTTTAFPSSPGANATFRSNNNTTQFHGTSSPPARYYDGTLSPMRITEISAAPTAANNFMTFRVGTGDGPPPPPPTYTLTVGGGGRIGTSGTTATGEYETGASVTVSAPETNGTQRFLRWSSDNANVTFSNPYNAAQSFNMPASDVSVTAHFTDVAALPASVEADEHGYSEGVSSNTNTAATGGTLARFAAGTTAIPAPFAEYIVQAATAGSYQFTYTVRAGSSASGAFRVMNVTSGVGVKIDSIWVELGQTLETAVAGVTFDFPNTRMILRLERVGGSGNLDIDQITVSAPGPVTYNLTVAGGGRIVVMSPGGNPVTTAPFEAGESVDIIAPEENGSNYFLKWTTANADISFNNPYNPPQTITMPAAAATVTANYTRRFTLPGAIEADSGYLSGVTSAANTGATGGRFATFSNNGSSAEYVVNIAEAGSYQLAYTVSTGGTAGTSATRVFKLVDAVTNEVIDSVNIPAGTALSAISGKTAQLAAGPAVWRLERVSGSLNIDVVTLAVPASVVHRGLTAAAFGIKAMSTGNVVFSVPAAGHVSIKMYDIRGRQVAVLSNGVKTPGVYSVNPALRRGRKLSQGVYIIRMKTEGYAKDIRFNYGR